MPIPENDLSQVGWNVETLRQHLSSQLNEQKEAVHRQFADIADQFTEVDLRYQQRFDASERALMSALTAAEKAVSSALQAAEKAVQKAEAAADKRFDAVNEFRAALTDQTNALMPRVEATARIDALGDKLTDISQRIATTKGAHDNGVTNQASLMTVLGVLIALAALGLTAYRATSPTTQAPQITVSPPATITH